PGARARAPRHRRGAADAVRSLGGGGGGPRGGQRGVDGGGRRAGLLARASPAAHRAARLGGGAERRERSRRRSVARARRLGRRRGALLAAASSLAAGAASRGRLRPAAPRPARPPGAPSRPAAAPRAAASGRIPAGKAARPRRAADAILRAMAMLLTRDEMTFDFGGDRLDPVRDKEIVEWILSQFLYGEMTGIQVGHWFYQAPDVEAAKFLARQSLEEMQHV